MNRTDREAFIRAWSGAWEAYGRSMTNNGLKLAFRALRDLSLDAVTAALTAHMNEQPSQPPTAGAIRQRIDGDPESRAQIAWAKLREAIQRVGPYRSIAFDDPLIHVAVRDLGGWPGVCEWTADELPFREQDFRRTYRAYVRQDGMTHPPYLVGLIEQANAYYGASYDPPALVGDPDGAEHVMRLGQERTRITRQPITELAQTMKLPEAGS